MNERYAGLRDTGTAVKRRGFAKPYIRKVWVVLLVAILINWVLCSSVMVMQWIVFITVVLMMVVVIWMTIRRRRIMMLGLVKTLSMHSLVCVRCIVSSTVPAGTTSVCCCRLDGCLIVDRRPFPLIIGNKIKKHKKHYVSTMHEKNAIP